MDTKRWDIKESKKAVEVDEIVDLLLENRGIKTKEQKEEFLNPKDPVKITSTSVGISDKEMEKALSRIKKAIKKNQEIVVYGDYDADGICATAIMWEALHHLGAKATPFIPDRLKDGYGINSDSIKSLSNKMKNLKLIITVDNGIVARDAVDTANNLGIDVIVTDHHTIGDKKPDSHALVHTTSTSGSAVSWFLAKEISPETARKTLELAAIGTVSDQLPLTGVNRSIVKYGLESINNTQRLGLIKLLMAAGLLQKKIGTYEINFMIAPRINASGRIATGMDALRLLCTKNSERAEDLANKLNALNTKRQAMLDESVKKAYELVINNRNSVLVVAQESFHEGIIGLISSKLTEKHWRPSIAFSVKGEVSKASARSIEGFNIINAIRQTGLILEGGGHEMAAGFSLETNKIEKFAKKINALGTKYLTPEVLTKSIKIDIPLQFSVINQKLYNTLSVLEPFGIGNPAPVFVTKNVQLTEYRLVGNDGKHMKMTLQQGDTRMNAIAFNFGNGVKLGKVDVVYRLSENEWNGTRSIELMVKDIREK